MSLAQEIERRGLEAVRFSFADQHGVLRGKTLAAPEAIAALERGVTVTSTLLLKDTSHRTVFPAFTPGGGVGMAEMQGAADVLMMPDRGAEANVDFGDGLQKEHFFLSDMLETDGTPWDCCPRTLLRNAAADLRREAGIRLGVAYEHEFVYSGANGRTGDMYGLDAIRRHGSFGEVFLAALDQCGVDADSYLSEFALNQFEVTFPPEEPLLACDKAIFVREMARWLTEHQLFSEGTRISNGSGLFDANRVSAGTLAGVLELAYRMPAIYPELLAQLAIGGVDGTLRSRFRTLAPRRSVRRKPALPGSAWERRIAAPRIRSSSRSSRWSKRSRPWGSRLAPRSAYFGRAKQSASPRPVSTITTTISTRRRSSTRRSSAPAPTPIGSRRSSACAPRA